MVALSLFATQEAQALTTYAVNAGDTQKRADAVLAVMGYSVVPDLSASTLSISNQAAGNPDLMMAQYAGGATLGKAFPLYLEGGLGVSRYDPKFLASDGGTTRRLPFKWTTVMATGGIGWDFPISTDLTFRPIFNFALGHEESDSSLAARYVDAKTGARLAFLENGRLNAGGLGGSLMLDYERTQDDRTVDIEARYSAVHLASIGDTSQGVRGHADIQTANLYTRWRAPTTLSALGQPLRYVLEGSFSSYLGDQRGILGFNNMSSLGVGIELNSSSLPVYVTQTRLVFRYAFGTDVRATSIGLAISF